ncbi:hypothetical protein EVAR_81058_1 [Eumeta japonica]|uniref:Uncharacterized protein n=1 Tax=Eumeta variegata TaxID=151549 RepID=A0A4C1T5I9_EUMVA|nr:hypothetical protein EVAR_81058_1 [Eumeta japonica]
MSKYLHSLVTERNSGAEQRTRAMIYFGFTHNNSPFSNKDFAIDVAYFARCSRPVSADSRRRRRLYRRSCSTNQWIVLESNRRRIVTRSQWRCRRGRNGDQKRPVPLRTSPRRASGV